MTHETPDFSIRVDGVRGVCPAAETWAEDKIINGRVPVLACESACIRGDIARLAANLIAAEPPFARVCYAETAFVPHSAMARWVRQAEQVVMINGCFLKCFGRVLNNLVDPARITHIDALSLYNKYTDVFYMEDVPETERREAARQVAEALLPRLRATVATKGDAIPLYETCADAEGDGGSEDCGRECGGDGGTAGAYVPGSRSGP